MAHKVCICLIYQLLQLSRFHIHIEYSLCYAWNNILGSATIKGYQLEALSLAADTIQTNRHSLQGIGRTTVDFLTGMTALKTSQLQGISLTLNFLCQLIASGEIHISTACTTYSQQIPILGITVNQILYTLEMVICQIDRTSHTGFLIHSNNSTNWSVALKIFHNVNNNGNPHTIISTKAGTVCMELISLSHQLNRILNWIIGHTIISHTNHIHVSLQYHQWLVLTIISSSHIRNNIIYLVLFHLTAHICKQLVKIIADSLLMTGRTRNLCQLGKFC